MRRLILAGIAGSVLVGTSLGSVSHAGPFPVVASAVGRHPQSGPEDVNRLYDDMTPLERVGQLFLVAFSRSSDDEPTADALRLVRELSVGGLVLQKGNAVFYNVRGEDLPSEIASMTAELQNAALSEDGPGIPLFIAVDHEGDGDPTTHLREGFTAVPSAMAIGATWEPDNARTIGDIVGRELQAVGVNLLLGPSLDVLAEPRVDSRGDIGTRSFGGDPYWVSEMGRAYVAGVHEGSGGRVATVAKHFPGHGGSDRLPDEEVATVNKSLSELRRVELPPFAAVTAGQVASASDASADETVGSSVTLAATDALMTSHIRYRGFQGDNIRSGTKPVSIDPEALRLILRLEGFPFGAWRDAGGLIVADSLGVRAIRRYDDPSGETFRHRAVARQALEAGNDLLILAQFATTPAWSVQLENVEDVVRYFARQYESDADFRARVDAAAKRVLMRKAQLYPEWEAEAVAADAGSPASVVGSADSRDAVAEISRRGVAMLRGDEHPRPGSSMVIITDDSGRLGCEGETCGLPPDRLDALPQQGSTLVASLLLERFGPAGTGTLRAGDVSEITFCQLDRALAPAAVATEQVAVPPEPGQGPSVPPGEGCTGGPSAQETLALLAAADWIVFAFADLRPAEVRDLAGHYLPTVNDLAQPSDSRLAVLSFGPPYYVDATNFAHLDVYIAAFSKIPSSIGAALDVLMGDRGAVGAPPVSIRDADYDLVRQLEPDPMLPLFIRRVGDDNDSDSVSSTTLPARIAVLVGPIHDRNGHPVPDDTEVELTASPGAALAGGTVLARTIDGSASAELVFPAGGRVEIEAESGDARTVDPLVLSLPVPTPTALPPTHDTTGSVDPDLQASVSPEPSEGSAASYLLLALATIVLVSGAGTATSHRRRRSPERVLRTLLLVAAGGLAAYVGCGAVLAWTLLAEGQIANEPGSAVFAGLLIGSTLVGACFGLLADLWYERRRLTME